MSCHNHSHFEIGENAKKTFIVVLITILTMVLEIVFGFITKSMALLADGFHMGTHAFALLVTFVAFILTEKYKNSELFPKGTGKISVLSGFVSSIFLGITGILVLIESVERFFNPLSINFSTAILVAIIGLVVNGLCLIVMESKSKNSDYNYKAAYLHILADALTSVFAIIALIAGKCFGLVYLDSIMGFVGAYLILKWSISLIKETSVILLDMHVDTNDLCSHKHHHNHDEHNHCYTR